MCVCGGGGGVRSCTREKGLKFISNKYEYQKRISLQNDFLRISLDHSIDVDNI